MHLNHAPMTPAEGAEEVKAAALIIVIILLVFLKVYCSFVVFLFIPDLSRK